MWFYDFKENSNDRWLKWKDRVNRNYFVVFSLVLFAMADDDCKISVLFIVLPHNDTLKS